MIGNRKKKVNPTNSQSSDGSSGCRSQSYMKKRWFERRKHFRMSIKSIDSSLRNFEVLREKLEIVESCIHLSSNFRDPHMWE